MARWKYTYNKVSTVLTDDEKKLAETIGVKGFFEKIKEVEIPEEAQEAIAKQINTETKAKKEKPQ